MGRNGANVWNSGKGRKLQYLANSQTQAGDSQMSRC